MRLNINDTSLVVYEALASSVRLHIIQLLSKNKMSIKDLATALGLSSAIVTMHVKKLEKAGIIKTEKIGQKKISSLKVDKIEIFFPTKIMNALDTKESSIPIGHYTDYLVTPTCGLATSDAFIGNIDEPKYFMDSKRMDAQILWFTQGFIEYQTPNLLSESEKLEMIEISMELSSEYPAANNHWLSDITFSLNEFELGTWTSPGDYADVRGRRTPEWYPDNQNQYGLLKTIRITNQGTYIDGEKLSNMTIDNFVTPPIDLWKYRIEVKADAEHVGGCTLFGKNFGNYDQDIKLKIFYS